MFIEGDELGLRMEAPDIGEHTKELLEELSYTEAQIKALFNAKIVSDLSS